MKKILIIISLAVFGFYSCTTQKQVASSDSAAKEIPVTGNDTIRIANEEQEYEIIIFEPGFNAWLASYARPRGYYSESFLENRNFLYVNEWNLRVNLPTRFDPNLYLMRIDYNKDIHYGYEVNYLLYNYFIFFQLKHNQRLAGFVPKP